MSQTLTLPWVAGGSPDSHLDEVYLDGQRLPLCIRAHAGQGWVAVYATDSDGEILIDGLGRPHTRLLHGNVSVRRVNG